MGPHGEGIGVEAEMARVLDDFERQSKTKPVPVEKMVHLLTRDEIYTPGSMTTLEDIARNPESLTFKMVKAAYPDAETRELVAGVLTEKYLKRGTSGYPERIDELERRHEAAIDQGHPPAEYTQMTNRYSEIYSLVQFFTLMNDAEFEEQERQWEKEARAAEKERKTALDREEALIKFEGYKILVPSQKAESGQVELTLREYIQAVATKVANGEISKKEYQIRVGHIKANFNFAIKPELKKFIFDKYSAERESAKKEVESWRRESILHELTGEEEIESAKAMRKLLKADNALKIMSEIIS